MSGLKLNDSIFDTSTDKYADWNFSGIVKDNVATNSKSSDIVDINSNTTTSTETNNSSWWDGMPNLFGDNDTNSTSGKEETTPSDSMFSGANIGSTLKGGGAVVGALSSIYGTLEQTKFNKEVLGMEKDRINRNIEREDKLQKNYQGVWS